MLPLSRRITVLALMALPLAGCGGSNPYQGMEAEQLYALGRQKYESRDWDDAIQALDRLLSSFASSERAPDARMLLANSYYGKGDYLTARSEYQRYLDRYAGYPEAAAAALGICNSLVALSPNPHRDQNYTNEALSVCQNVVVDYAGTPQAEQAATLASQMRRKLAEKEFLSASFYFRRKLYDSAIIYYQFVVEQYPESEFAPQALLGIYRSNKAIGYDDLADQAKEQLLSKYPDSPAAAEVRTNGSSS